MCAKKCVMCAIFCKQWHALIFNYLGDCIRRRFSRISWTLSGLFFRYHIHSLSIQLNIRHIFQAENVNDYIKRRFSRVILALSGLFLWYHFHSVSMQLYKSYLKAENIIAICMYFLKVKLACKWVRPRIFKISESFLSESLAIMRRTFSRKVMLYYWSFDKLFCNSEDTYNISIVQHVIKTCSHIWDERLAACYYLIASI